MHRSRYPLVAVCLVVYFIPFLTLLTLSIDEGWVLTGALRVLRGEIPYRDFFEFVGPGTFYWVAPFFGILGETWLASRVCILITGLGTCLLVYHLALRLQPASAVPALVVWVAAAFPTWMTINHHTVSNLFALPAFALTLRWLDTGRPGLLFAAGIFGGLTSAAMIQKGGLLGLGLVATLGLRRAGFRAVLELGAGAAAALLPVALYFQSNGALDDLVFANFVWPIQNYSEAGHVPYGFGISGYWVSGPALIPALLIWLLPVVVAAQGLLNRRTAFSRTYLPYWIAGAMLWISEIHRPDLLHLSMASPVLLVLAAALAASGPALLSRRIVTWISALAAGVNLLLMLVPRQRIETPAGAMRVLAANPVLEFTNRYVKPGDTIFVYPYLPIYYFLSKTLNPTRFSYLLYNHQTPGQMREVVESLEKDKTRYVIWESDFETRVAPALLPSYRAPLEKERVIEPYLLEHYRQVGKAGGVIFLERKQ